MDGLKVAVVLVALLGAGVDSGRAQSAAGPGDGWTTHDAGWAQVALPPGWKLVYRCGPDAPNAAPCGCEAAAAEFEHASGAFFAVTEGREACGGSSGAWQLAPVDGGRVRVVRAPSPGCWITDSGAADCRETVTLVEASAAVVHRRVTFLFGTDGTGATFDAATFRAILESVRIAPAPEPTAVADAGLARAD
jgi:hypothetical protein